jgi:hypothetical protein|tara:strand:+ start:2586 stop:2927 length:342 start_codon:yes stop_codon:yes gene_type:complete
MARGENEDVTGLNLPDPLKVSVVFYDKAGKETEESQAVAKEVSTLLNHEDFSVQQFILYGRGEILDPHGIDTRCNRRLYQYKKVAQDAFDSYIKYLKSKNVTYFTRARRLIMG